MRPTIIPGLIALTWLLSQSAVAQRASDDDVGCYDAKIVARPTAQIPSVIPEPDDPNTIIMSWPWFLDLKVTRIIEGRVPQQLTDVLSVQHVDFLPRPRTWWLRRNTAGTFNSVHPWDGNKLRRCPRDIPAAQPFLRPEPGKSLQEYRAEGARHYAQYLNQATQ